MFKYGEKWRTYRRLFHEFFNVATVGRYDENQNKTTSRLLKSLSEHPEDFHRHIQLATGSLALSIAYGIQVDSVDNPYFHVAEEATASLQAALVPGAFPVEFLPFRKQTLLGHFSNAILNPLSSPLRSIVAPWRWCSQLWATRLQVLNGQLNANNAICHGKTQSTLSPLM